MLFGEVDLEMAGTQFFAEGFKVQEPSVMVVQDEGIRLAFHGLTYLENLVFLSTDLDAKFPSVFQIPVRPLDHVVLLFLGDGMQCESGVDDVVGCAVLHTGEVTALEVEIADLLVTMLQQLNDVFALVNSHHHVGIGIGEADGVTTVAATQFNERLAFHANALGHV